MSQQVELDFLEIFEPHAKKQFMKKPNTTFEIFFFTCGSQQQHLLHRRNRVICVSNSRCLFCSCCPVGEKMGLFSWLNEKVNDIKNSIYGDDAAGEAETSSEKTTIVPRNHVVFVRTRTSSMFFDRDGDLAHEFYEEVAGGLRRLTKDLTPEGLVELDVPTISPSCRAVVLPRQSRPG
jgi:hypothetical protein